MLSSLSRPSAGKVPKQSANLHVYKPLQCHSRYTKAETLVTQQLATLVTQQPAALVSEHAAAGSQLAAAAAMLAPLHCALPGKPARQQGRLKLLSHNRQLPSAAWPASSPCVTGAGQP